MERRPSVISNSVISVRFTMILRGPFNAFSALLEGEKNSFTFLNTVSLIIFLLTAFGTYNELSIDDDKVSEVNLQFFASRRFVWPAIIVSKYIITYFCKVKV